jgi:hypothetical protein
MLHKIFIVLDEICHWLKLMYLFLRHVVQLVAKKIRKGNFPNVPSRAINFGRQCHFEIWLDCHKLKKKSLPDYAHVNKVSKK